MFSNNNKNETTKHKILQCFWDLYHEKSIEKISVSELTKKANINRSTFYAYFKDIYDVLDQIEELYIPDGIDFFRHCHDIDDKEKMYHTFLNLFDRNYKNFAFLLSDQGDPNFVIKLKNRARPILKDSVPIEIQSNKFFDLTIEYVLSSMIAVITYWANHPSDITSREMFNHLHDLYVKGIPYTIQHETK